MDNNTKRLDFRRATICVPPSAINSYCSLSNDVSSGPFTSPLHHKYSPRTHFLNEEPQRERMIGRSQSINFSRGVDHFGQTNSSTQNGYNSSFSIPEGNYYNENEFVDENKPRMRRLSSSNFESHKIFQNYTFPDTTKSFEKRRKSFSSAFNPKDLENLNVGSNQPFYPKSSFVSMDHIHFNHEQPSFQSNSRSGSLSHPNPNQSLSVPTSPKPAKSDSSKFSLPISSPSIEKPFFLSHLSRKIFGSTSMDESMRDDYDSHEKMLSFSSSQPNLSKSPPNSLFSFDPMSVSNDHHQRESPVSGSRANSPRPISPFGTLLLRTEF